MPDATNVAELALRCLVCAETLQGQPLGEALHPSRSWPDHCGQPMVLANLTDRDGNALDPEDHQ